jgi:hypothetical protein
VLITYNDPVLFVGVEIYIRGADWSLVFKGKERKLWLLTA